MLSAIRRKRSSENVIKVAVETERRFVFFFFLIRAGRICPVQILVTRFPLSLSSSSRSEKKEGKLLSIRP